MLCLITQSKTRHSKNKYLIKKKENKKKRMNGGKDTNSDSNVQKYISGVLKIVIVRA